MNYDPKLNWESDIKSTIQKNVYPAQGLIRIIKGEYPKLSPVVKGSKVLDVGCGDGRNSDFLSREGFKVTGLEIEQSIINLLQEKYSEINFIVGNNISIPSGDAVFDIIIAWNSCYYLGPNSVVEMKDVFKEYKRVLKNKNGSRLILSIPMHTSFIYKDCSFLRSQDDVNYVKITSDPFEIRNGEQLAQFTSVESLEKALKKSGFNKIEVGEEMGNWFGYRYDWWVVSALI